MEDEEEGRGRRHGGGEDVEEEDEEEEEDGGSRVCAGPRAWVVVVATLPFLAIGVSLSCIGYLAPAEGKDVNMDTLRRHFRIAGPVFLAGCGVALLLTCLCRRPTGGRVAAVGPGRGAAGAGGGGEWWNERGKGGGPPPGQEAAPWGSRTAGDSQYVPSPGKGPKGPPYPSMTMMAPPLLKVIPPTPESPAARKGTPEHRGPSPRHLLLLTPLRLKQRT